MLVVQVYQHGGANHAAALDELLGKKGMSKDEVDRVRQVFRDSGALGFTEKAMTELLTSGQKALNKAKPPLTKKYKQFLIDLSEFLVKRSY
jgi:geranylgeranyl pyrophosphate synthase